MREAEFSRVALGVSYGIKNNLDENTAAVLWGISTGKRNNFCAQTEFEQLSVLRAAFFGPHLPIYSFLIRGQNVSCSDAFTIERGLSQFRSTLTAIAAHAKEQLEPEDGSIVDAFVDQFMHSLNKALMSRTSKASDCEQFN